MFIDENLISEQIIGAAIEVHKELGGPGLYEKMYESALAHELTLRNISFKRQYPVPVTYKGCEVKDPYILDLIVEDKVVVEIKAVDQNSRLHDLQLNTYLRLAGKKLGLVINFGLPMLKDGISRVVNGL